MSNAEEEKDENEAGENAKVKPPKNWGLILNISLLVTNVIVLAAVLFSTHLAMSSFENINAAAESAQSAYFETTELVKLTTKLEKTASAGQKLASDAASLSGDNKKLNKAVLSKLKQGVYCR